MAQLNTCDDTRAARLGVRQRRARGRRAKNAHRRSESCQLSIFLRAAACASRFSLASDARRRPDAPFCMSLTSITVEVRASAVPGDSAATVGLGLPAGAGVRPFMCSGSSTKISRNSGMAESDCTTLLI
jgi:hypothetical protein